jgi:cbb3-type cytochrome oxidase maturation protein
MRLLRSHRAMESMWLLIPLSAVLVLLVIAVFAWALHRGQFEDLEDEGARILLDEAPPAPAVAAGPAGLPPVSTPNARAEAATLKS